MSSMAGYDSNKALKKSGYKSISVPTMSPEVMDRWRRTIGAVEPSALSSIGDLGRISQGDESYFQQLEAPAHRQYQQGIGQLASRFSAGGPGSGSMSARQSSAFANAGAGYAGEFAENLAAQRYSLQDRAREQLLSLYGELMSSDPYEQVLQKRKQSGWKKWLGASLPIIGGVAGGIAGGPAGAIAGSSIGSSAGGAFFD